MPDDEVPKLPDWLADYRSRPDPVEVVVASFHLAEPVPDEPSQGMAAGQIGLDIVRYDAPSHPGPPDTGHYVMGRNHAGEHLWDDWYESEEAAREAIASDDYGVLTQQPSAND